MKTEKCIYEPGSLHIIDMMNDTGDISLYSNMTIDQIKKEYPAAEIMPFEKALELIAAEEEKKICTIPMPTTEEHFMDMLEAVPPRCWKHGQGYEYFCMGEMYSGNIGSLFFRVGEKYYSCLNRITRLPEILKTLM